MGELRAVTLVGRSDENGRRVYHYRLEFANARILQRYTFTAEGQLAAGESEAVETNPLAFRSGGG